MGGGNPAIAMLGNGPVGGGIGGGNPAIAMLGNGPVGGGIGGGNPAIAMFGILCLALNIAARLGFIGGIGGGPPGSGGRAIGGGEEGRKEERIMELRGLVVREAGREGGGGGDCG
jgi:hypothetical protein